MCKISLRASFGQLLEILLYTNQTSSKKTIYYKSLFWKTHIINNMSKSGAEKFWHGGGMAPGGGVMAKLYWCLEV